MKKKIIFGAGYFGRQALLYYGQSHVAYFVDNNLAKKGDLVEGITVLSYNEYIEIESKYETIIACSVPGTIAEQLNASGIHEYTVYPIKFEHRDVDRTKLNDIYNVNDFNIEYLLNHIERPKGVIKKIFFIGDNTDNANWGCRATSQALYDIINKTAKVTDILRRNEILSCFSDTCFCDDVLEYYGRVRQKDKQWSELRKRVEKVDGVVLNGEGSFIFRTPPRYDLHIYLCILMLCIELKKPFYVLNTMFTDGNGFERNVKLLNDTIRILQHSNLVTARDPASLAYLKQADKEELISLKYVPDALFSWYDIFQEYFEEFENLLKYQKYCRAFDSEDELGKQQMDFTKDYVLLSGNSYVAAFPEQGIEMFSRLAMELRKTLNEMDINLYLTECCVGDRFLRQVSVDIGIPIIKVENNIYFEATILQRARCFVSGRYHPSILAFLGGTACVLMGSNSHKTESLQKVLQLKEMRIFEAIPSNEEIQNIVNRTIEVLSTDQSREIIKKVCKENSENAQKLQFCYEEI